MTLSAMLDFIEILVITSASHLSEKVKMCGAIVLTVSSTCHLDTVRKPKVHAKVVSTWPFAVL